tara:strand:- start:212 stop:430 length:219 start_codon:yes stop_codon:yes gene_type:complete
MTQIIAKFFNATTGKEILRDMTKNEIAFHENRELENKQRAEKIAQEQALRDSANEKLAALGLTPEEIAAIIS